MLCASFGVNSLRFFQRGRMTFSRYELAPHPYFELHIRKYEIGHEIDLTLIKI